MAMNYYNSYPYMNGNQSQALKGRPVTSFEEVRASMIDFDGSIFYFPDVANKKIYTKQINGDGTPNFKVYNLVEQQPIELAPMTAQTVTKEDFDKTISSLANEIAQLKQKIYGDNKEEYKF